MNLLEKKILYKKAILQIKQYENQKDIPSIKEIIIAISNSLNKNVERIGE